MRKWFGKDLVVARDLPIATIVAGTTIRGTITTLYMNDLEVRIEDGSNRVKSIHAPYFQVAIPRLRYTTEEGTLSEHGREVAVGILERLHESRS